MEVIEIKVENPFFKQVKHLCLKIENSIFVPVDQAKHFCMISVKELFKNVEDDVVPMVMLFMFGIVKPIKYEKAIRTTIDKTYEQLPPFSPFRYTMLKVEDFKEGPGWNIGELGNSRRRTSKHKPEPRYAGYVREIFTPSEKPSGKPSVRKFLCCMCSSCGEFQVMNHDSWVNFFMRKNDPRIQFKRIEKTISQKAQCRCGLDAEYANAEEQS